MSEKVLGFKQKDAITTGGLLKVEEYIISKNWLVPVVSLEELEKARKDSLIKLKKEFKCIQTLKLFEALWDDIITWAKKEAEK